MRTSPSVGGQGALKDSKVPTMGGEMNGGKN